ncbi:MAG: hypothetical protein R2742_02385 [Micropruina glycogenica]
MDALSEAESFAEIADRFRGTGLDVQVDARVDWRPTQALVVRRCIQEGLTNVVRHARRVRLVVRQDADRVGSRSQTTARAWPSPSGFRVDRVAPPGRRARRHPDQRHLGTRRGEPEVEVPV